VNTISQSADFLSASEVARLAGRGASAVSNWRRRHADFPSTRGRAANGAPLFARDEVEEYLARHGYLPDASGRAAGWPDELLELGDPDLVINAAMALIASTAITDSSVDRTGLEVGTDEEVGRRLAELTSESVGSLIDGQRVFAPLLGGGATDGRRNRESATSRVSKTSAVLLGRVWRLVDAALRDGGPEANNRPEVLFEAVLGLRLRERSRRLAETRTAGWVSRLLVELTDAGAGVVLDLAAGEAGFLLDAAAAADGITLIGQESDELTWRIARQRLLVHRVRADFRLCDSLDDDGRSHEADVVLCDPPFGLKLSPDRWPPTDERWRFGIPAPNADLAWIQLAIHRLRPGGRAAVLLPAASLYQPGLEARIRVELLRASAIEAIVALPRRTKANSQSAVAVWLLRRPEDALEDDVLLVDAADGPAPALTDLDEEAGESPARHELLIASVLTAVRDWRKRGRRARLAPDFAVTVTGAELIAANAELLPARWTHSTRREDPADGLQQAIRQIKELSRVDRAAQVRVKTLDGAPPVRRRLRELIAEGVLKVVPGARIESSSSPDACRAWGPWDFRGEPVRYTLAQAVTEPGDIIVLQSSDGPRALVDEVGGCAIAAPVQAIRLDAASAIGASLDTRVCAAFLADPENMRIATGTSSGRANLTDLELPILDADLARRLGDALVVLRAEQQRAAELADRTQALGEKLLSAVGSGAVEIV